MKHRPYCTYLTIYYGNKMPMFYIGYTLTIKYMNGFDAYHGSVSSRKYFQIWKQELKENPHLFKTRILTFHDTKEDALKTEIKFQKHNNADKNPLFINQSIGNVRFFNIKGLKHSEETKKKISEGRKGKGGNGGSLETLEKIRTSLMGHKVTEESKKKISIKLTGRKFSDSHRENISRYQKGRK